MTSGPDSDALKIQDGALSVLISRNGGALLGASFDGREFLVSDGKAANFPLVPFGNRLEHNAFTFDGQTYHLQPNSSDPFYLHGDGWLEVWDIDAISAKSVTLSLLHRAHSDSPYDYHAIQVISAEADTLMLDLSVTNTGSTALPFGLGQHPFFARTPLTRLTARMSGFLTERDGHLPSPAAPCPADLDFHAGARLPARFVNNAFPGWDGQAHIEWPEFALAADLVASSAHDVAMIYMPDHGQDFFCFEPMTHLPNGHHLPDLGGLRRLEPGETMSGRVTISLRRI